MEDLKDKRDGLNARVKELGEEKRKFVEDIKALNTIIKQEKDSRDKANQEVKSLKEKRVASFEEIKKLKKEMDELLKVLEKFKDSMGGSYGMLKEELKQMEWEYQTEVHSIKKEKELVKQMDELEKYIAKSELLYDKKKNLIRIQHSLRDLYTEANVYHGLLMNRAKDSEKHHDSMMKNIRQIGDLDKKISDLEKNIREAREEADKYHKELKDTMKTEPTTANMEELRKKGEQILANFKSGKKVTMDELALLQQLGLY